MHTKRTIQGLWVGFCLWTALGTAFAVPAKFGASPDNSLGLLTEVLSGAQHRLLINIYEFDHPGVLKVLLEKVAQPGFELKVLIEAQPVSKMSRGAWETLKTLREAMASQPGKTSHLYLMRKLPVAERRFRFNHAKYVVADDRWSLVSSENFSRNGHPSAGRVGNRGWSVVVDDPLLARELVQLFERDSDLSYGDVEEPRTIDIPNFAEPTSFLGDSLRGVPAVPSRSGHVASHRLILAPNSVPDTVALIQKAKKNLETQHMSMPRFWSKVIPNPIVDAWIAAAQRGVAVRALLNDERAFAPPGAVIPDERRPNLLTARALQKLAVCDRLPIEARIIDRQATQTTYVHNKGLLIDDRMAMVSSINGSQNSNENNREVAIALESADAAGYFGSLFNWDWQKSGALPRDGFANCTRLEMNTGFDLFESIFPEAF